MNPLGRTNASQIQGRSVQIYTMSVGLLCIALCVTVTVLTLFQSVGRIAICTPVDIALFLILHRYFDCCRRWQENLHEPTR